MRRGIYQMRKPWFRPNTQLPPEPGTPCSRVTTAHVRLTHQQSLLATLKHEGGEFCHDRANIAGEDRTNVMLLSPKAADTTPVDEIQLKTVKPIAATSGQPQSVSGSDQHGGSYPFVRVDLAVEPGTKPAIQHQQTHPRCDGQLRLQAQAEECRGLPSSRHCPVTSASTKHRQKNCMVKYLVGARGREVHRWSKHVSADWSSKHWHCDRRCEETVGSNGHSGPIRDWSAKGGQTNVQG